MFDYIKEMDFNYNNYIKFSFGLKTILDKTTGIERKDPKLRKNWQLLEKDYLIPSDNAVGILTGKKNNLTVFDFDNKEEYERFFEYFNELNKNDYFTVKTKKGYHLYFQYDEECKQGTNVMSIFNGIDIRNDGGFITAPPTSYKFLDGSIYNYEYVDLTKKILPVPEQFKKYLTKLIESKENEKKKMIKEEKKKQKELKEQQKKDKKGETYDEKEVLYKMIDIIQDMAEDYDTWNKVAMALHNHENDYFEIFDKFSQYSDKYDESNVFLHWEKLKQKDNGLSIASIFYWAKQKDEIQYNNIMRKRDFDEKTISDLDEAKYVYSLYPYWKSISNDDKSELYMFDDTIGIWTKKNVTHQKKIIELARGRYGNDIRSINKLLQVIPTLCIDDNFFKNANDSSLGYLLFKNGIYNSKKGEFKPEFTPSIVFFGRIHNDYKLFTKEQLYDIEKRLFINPLNNDVAHYQLTIFARALMGEKMKKILFCLGGANNGKSTITQCFKKSCDEYTGTFDASNFAVKNMCDNDPARGFRWALSLQHARIIFSNELTYKINMSSELVKKHTGDDDIQGRKHQGYETEFIPHYMPVVFANDLSKFDTLDPALDCRIDIFGYEKKFVDTNIKPILDDDELPIDPNLKEEIKTIEFQQKFVMLLISKYEQYKQRVIDNQKLIKDNKTPLILMPVPDDCIKSKSEWISQDINIISSFLCDFTITNDEDDKLPNINIEQWLKDKNNSISINKFNKELKKYLEKNGNNKVDHKPFKYENKTVRGWVGIKDNDSI